jgi:hypothetical protein
MSLVCPVFPVDIPPEQLATRKAVPPFTPQGPNQISAPGTGGGASYSPISYSPRTGLLYVAAIDSPQNAGRPAKGYFSAFDPETGELVWQKTFEGYGQAGSVVTAGGLIFTGSVLLVGRDMKDPARFVEKLRSGADPVSRELWARIPDESRLKLAQGSSNPNQQRVLLTEGLNTLLKGTNSLYETQRFAGVSLSEETRALLSKSPKKGELVYLHRLLLEDSFPSEIGPHRFSLKGLLWINMVIFAIIGFLVYVPVMFSGVMSLDLTTKKAVGTSAGFAKRCLRWSKRSRSHLL